MLTIAIPFYRNITYLKQAVESVLAQNSSQYQILVSDDCGPDGDAARQYIMSLQSDKIRYVRQTKNLGLAGNWNYCLKTAETPLVTLLHADDRLKPDYVRRMTEAAALLPDAAMIYCAADIINEHGRPTFSFPDFYKRLIAPHRQSQTLKGDAGLSSLMKGCFIMCPTICYRKNLIEQHQFSETWRMVLDLEFYAQVLFSQKEIAGIPDKLYDYRRHSDNQTSQLTASLVRFQEEVAIYNKIARTAKDRHWRQTAKIAGKKSIIKKNLLYCITVDLLSFRIRAALTKLRFLRLTIRTQSS